MKRISFVLMFLFAAALARAQLVTTGSITTSTGTVVTAVPTTLYSGLMVSIHGTYGSFTANFELSDDNGTTWYSVMCTRQDSLTTQEVSEVVSPDNSSRAWTCPLGGANLFRVRASALASGTVSLRITQSNQVSAKGGGGGASSLPAGTVTPSIIQTGLMAQYDFNQGSGTVLTDKSTNGNNGTLCAAGAAPTWVSGGTGGLQFAAASSQCVTLPSALNSALTIQIFLAYPSVNLVGLNATNYVFPIVGNGTAANTAGLGFREGNGGNVGFPNEVATYAGAINPAMVSYAGGFQQISLDELVGQGMVTLVMDATLDSFYINQYGPLPCSASACTGHSAGVMTSGVFQFGGRGAGFINSNSSFWSGIIYYALFYSTELTAAQVGQNYAAVATALAARGIPAACQGNVGQCPLTSNVPSSVGLLPPGIGARYATSASNNDNVLISTGDSIDNTNGGYFAFMSPSTTVGKWIPIYVSHSGQNVPDNPGQEPLATCSHLAPNALNVDHIWWGQNEQGGVGFINRLAAHSQLLRKCGFKTIVTTSLSCNCAGEAVNNNLIRQFWPTFADALADVSNSPALGATAASTNATYFPDGLHLGPNGHNVAAGVWQRALNRVILGNQSFSAGNTYTTTAPAATAITAATESTNTVTLTFAATPATFVIGADLYITGVTPAGYNTTSADTICRILTSTATQVTCNNATSGLGAGTVFGTAAVATQLDVDTYVTLAGSATSPVFSLETCQGLTDSKVYLKNSNTTSPWVIESQGQLSGVFSTETIDGATTLTMPTASSGNNPVVILQAVGPTPAAGGCVWKRLE